MRSCLVTGASGLIGRHLAHALASSWEVHTLDKDPLAASLPEVHQHQVDLTSPALADALPSRIDAVVHLAQAERYREFPEAAPEVFAINTQSTLRLLDWAQKAGATKMLFASTGGLYVPKATALTEEDPIQIAGPLAFYFASKRSSELVLEAYRSVLDTVVLRFFFVYGPGQKSGMLMPRLVKNVRSGTPITLQGPDGLRICPLHAADAAEQIVALLERPGSGLYNAAGPEELSLRKVGELIGQALGIEPRFSVDLTAKPADLIADISKLSALVGAPKIRLAEGLSRWIASNAPELE